MSSTSFEDKLKDLKLTNDELQRFSDAFKNDEFRKLFLDYAEELNDPKNRELYEQEIRAVEEQQGSDVTFIHPKAGHVLKTTVNGKEKCFINIATNEHVEKPSFTKVNQTSGKQGAQWSLPHCLAGPHEDVDHQSKICIVYDVIFSPDTYRMAETNNRFMKMVEDSALDSVEKNYHCKLDRNNVKSLKMKFKGVPKPTIIRKKIDPTAPVSSSEPKSESDEIIDKAISAAQNHKVVLSSHNRQVNNNPLKQNEETSLQTDENGFTIPTYRIIHRGDYDMQDNANAILPQVRSMRPKEILVDIDLPLCASSSNVDLDVCERTLKLHCDSPKYSLDLTLPYPVRESDSHAKFDKKQRKLIVTLAVIKETTSIVEFQMEDDDEMEEEEETSPTVNHQIVPTIENCTVKHFSAIPFEYKQGQAHLALVLNVKNVEEKSFQIENDGQHLTIRLSSIGSGCFPLEHQLCLDFDEPMTFECGENATNLTVNEEKILILLKKTAQQKRVTQFFSGISRDEMKRNSLEDFLLDRNNSSSTSTSDESKKSISKRQAKKLAKKNDQDQLVENLQHDDDAHLSDSTSNSKPHPSIYRRHMSESQVEREPTSNGEFKLKGILKNSTKYRSFSESFSEPRSNFVREESVFEACSTTDDLTSSNENNSIVTSPDSNGTHGGSSSLCTTPGSAIPVKHVTFNNQVSRKTFKPGGPVSGMKKISSNQQRKLKKRRRQDSLNSQSSDQDDHAPQKPSPKSKSKPSDTIDQPTSNGQSTTQTTENEPSTKSAVRLSNAMIFELEN